MGRLIDMLKVYSDDNGLIADLKEIKKRRDQVAHQSLLMTVEEINNKETIHIKASKLEDMKKSTDATLKKILEKWKDLDNILNKISAMQGSGGKP